MTHTIPSELTRHQINGTRRDTRYQLCLDYADGKISKADLAAWDDANPIDWDGFEYQVSTQREGHGGVATPSVDRFEAP